MSRGRRLYRLSDIGAHLADVVAEAQNRLSGESALGPIPTEMTFREWCEGLAQERIDPITGERTPGLLVDGKPFTLEDRPAMAWLYDQIPSTREEAFRRTLVLMKCTQVGFTVMEMLAAIYLALKFQPSTIGMFLPDIALAEGKSTERFMPIVRSLPSVHKLMTQDAPGRIRPEAGGGQRAAPPNWRGAVPVRLDVRKGID